MHRERPFFQSLVEFMTSGPVVVQVLEGENAIAALNGKDLDGRALNVNEAHPKPAGSGARRPNGGGYRGR